MRGKLFLGITLAVIVFIQFVNSKLPETAAPDHNDLFIAENVPDDVKNIILRSCYDCHSMQTRYPWYSYVAPVKWLIQHDINWGRGGVNFSKWGSLDDKDKIKRLTEISEVIDKKEMPLGQYLILHSRAKLTADDRQKIISWADSTADSYFE